MCQEICRLSHAMSKWRGVMAGSEFSVAPPVSAFSFQAPRDHWSVQSGQYKVVKPASKNIVSYDLPIDLLDR
jgi:hypothetical protein